MQKKPQIGNDLRLKVMCKSVKFLFFFVVPLTGCTPLGRKGESRRGVIYAYD